jgi:hypothetical protein
MKPAKVIPQVESIDQRPLSPFLEKNLQIKGVMICVNFRGLQGTGVPHGSLVHLENDATVTKALLPEDQGSCVAMIKILNFDPIEHTRRMRDPQLNEQFLMQVGDGPTLKNTYCNSLAIDLGREIEPWKPHLGKGTIGVVAQNNAKEWEKKHYIAVALPSLPFAVDACLAISGKSMEDFSSHHYVTEVVPKLIERNVRKLAALYAKTFNFQVDQSNDSLCAVNCTANLPTLSSFCYDPLVHVEDGKRALSGKMMVSKGLRNIMLRSPLEGLETHKTSSKIQIPFGVAHVNSSRQATLNEASRKYYSSIAYWPGKTEKLHEKLVSRVYSTDLVESFYSKMPRVEKRQSYQWISMVFGK